MGLKNMVNWKLFFILLIASLLSTLAVLPYALTLQAEIHVTGIVRIICLWEIHQIDH